MYKNSHWDYFCAESGEGMSDQCTGTFRHPNIFEIMPIETDIDVNRHSNKLSENVSIISNKELIAYWSFQAQTPL